MANAEGSFRRKVEDGNSYRNSVVANYDKMLAMASNRALFDVFLLKLTPILGFSSVTWATIVLLGGFAGTLSLADFLTIAFLVFMMGTRFAAGFLGSNMTGKSRQRIMNRDPEDAAFQDFEVDGYKSSPCLRLFRDVREGYMSSHRMVLSLAGEGVFVLSSAGLSLWRLSSIHRQAESPLNMKISLYIYFILVLLNAPFPIFYLLLGRFHGCDKNWSRDVKSYFDDIWSRALNGSISNAVSFNVFDFFFNQQARDYACNKQPDRIQEHYSQFFYYLLARPDGFLLLEKCLESEDIFKQRAAVNIVSFWSSNRTDRRLQQILAKLSNRFVEKLIAKMMVNGTQLGYDAAKALDSLLKCLKGMGSTAALLRICENGNSGMLEFLGKNMDESDAYLCLLVTILEWRCSESGEAPVESLTTQAEMKVYARDALLKAGFLDCGQINGKG